MFQVDCRLMAYFKCFISSCIYLIAAKGVVALDLSSQNLIKIPNTTVIPPTVTILILNYNDIERIFADDLTLYTDLLQLRMIDTGLRVIEDGAFDSNNKLEHLNCQNNMHLLEYLPSSFGPLKLSLTFLHLWASLQMNVANFNFRELHALRWLNIGASSKRGLDPSKLPRSLLVLYLNYNALYNFPNFAPHTPNLTELYAPDTRVSDIPDEFIIGLTKLKRLDLGGNHLRTLPDLYHLPLVNLGLRGNPLNCNRSLCWVRMWNYKKSPALKVEDAVCKYPLALAGTQLMQVNPVRLGCFQGEIMHTLSSQLNYFHSHSPLGDSINQYIQSYLDNHNIALHIHYCLYHYSDLTLS